MLRQNIYYNLICWLYIVSQLIFIYFNFYIIHKVIGMMSIARTSEHSVVCSLEFMYIFT